MSLTPLQINAIAKEVNKNSPMLEVLKIYGIDTGKDKTGKMHCPSLAHTDKVASAVYYPRTNTIFCFSENKVFNPINIVREQEGCDFFTACEILKDRFNIELPYQLPREAQKDFKDRFPLNEYDYSILGLSKETVINIPIAYKKAKGRDTVDYIEGAIWQDGKPLVSIPEICDAYNVGYEEADDILSNLFTKICSEKDNMDYASYSFAITYETRHYGIRDLFKEDPVGFAYLIYSKATERLEYFNELSQSPAKSGKQAYFINKSINRLEKLIDDYKDKCVTWENDSPVFDNEADFEVER